jgi:hypothetical protein
MTRFFAELIFATNGCSLMGAASPQKLDGTAVADRR